MASSGRSGALAGSADGEELETQEELIEIEQPVEVKDDKLISLLPSIQAVVTAYVSSKGKRVANLNIEDKSIPLTKLTASVRDESTLRTTIQSLKDDKSKELDHGILKELAKMLGDRITEQSSVAEPATATSVLWDALKRKAISTFTSFAEVPVKAVSAAAETFGGVSQADQKKIAYGAARWVIRRTKAQHIVEVIDSCIQAKDKPEPDYESLIAHIRKIQDTHVPSQDNLRRKVWGRQVAFETVFLQFCDNAIALIQNIKRAREVQAATKSSVAPLSPSSSLSPVSTSSSLSTSASSTSMPETKDQELTAQLEAQTRVCSEQALLIRQKAEELEQLREQCHGIAQARVQAEEEGKRVNQQNDNLSREKKALEDQRTNQEEKIQNLQRQIQLLQADHQNTQNAACKAYISLLLSGGSATAVLILSLKGIVILVSPLAILVITAAAIGLLYSGYQGCRTQGFFKSQRESGSAPASLAQETLQPPSPSRQGGG